MNKLWKYNTPGISDELFVRGKVPMTKAEVRAITISKLKLSPRLNFVDIGAGTGSISIEIASLDCDVTAIERNLEAINLIKRNEENFGVKLENIIHGIAPDDLIDTKNYDRAFIGGSGGNIANIFSYIDQHLVDGGIIVANTITIENTQKILQLFKEFEYTNVEVITVNISQSKNVGSVHMMMAENPINIISGQKGE